MLGALVAVGCAGPTVPPLPDGLPSAAGCVPDPDNALRATCRWTRAEPGPIEVRLQDPTGQPPIVFTGDPDARDVTIGLWDLSGFTGYDWAIVDRGAVVDEGGLVTPTVPDAFQPVVDVVIDGATSVDRVLLPLSCADSRGLAVLDARMRTRWYEPLVFEGDVTGFGHTDQDTLVALVGRNRLLEWDVYGATRTNVSLGAGLDRVVHHAVATHGTELYALDTEPVPYPDGVSYLVDGVTAVTLGADAGAHVWDLGQVMDPTGLQSTEALYWLGQFGGAVDFAHENGIDVYPDGDWLLSFKVLDTIARIDRDTGAARWTLTGGDSAAVWDAPALALSGCCGLVPSFQHPHAPILTPSGSVLVVDNGDGLETTRVLELAVDEDALTAEVVAAWDLGVVCPVQSSAYPLPDGAILAACARTGELFELDASGIRRRVKLSCTNGGGLTFTRAIPLSWPNPR